MGTAQDDKIDKIFTRLYVLEGLFIAIFGAVLAFLWTKVEAVDDAREKGTADVLKELNASNTQLRDELHTVDKQQVEFTARLEKQLAEVTSKKRH